MNVKRVHRLWRQARLSLPSRRPRRRRADRTVCRPVAATRPNQVWTYDFVQDACANGQRLKILTLTDECTRESLAIEVATRMSAQQVIRVLDRVIRERGAPGYVRSDNGPEFVAQAVQQWLKQRQIQTAYSEPGSPWQNAYGESFNGRLRDECLNGVVPQPAGGPGRDRTLVPALQCGSTTQQLGLSDAPSFSPGV